MLAPAPEGLEKTPRIETFRIPRTRSIRIIGVYMVALLYFHFAPPWNTTTSSFWAPAQLIVQYPYVSQGIRNAFVTTMLIHVLESMYALWLCLKHRSSWLATIQYVAATVAFGFPVLLDLRLRMEAAPRASVSKSE